MTALHIMLDVFDRLHLPGRLLIGKSFLEFMLILGVVRVGDALGFGALRVEREKLLRQFLRFLLRLRHHALPFLRAEAREHRFVPLLVHVLAQLVCLIHWHEELVAFGIREFQIFALGAIHGLLRHPLEMPYSMLHMHHIIAGDKRRDEIQSKLLDAALLARLLEREDLPVCKERASEIGVLHRVGQEFFLRRREERYCSIAALVIDREGNTFFAEDAREFLEPLGDDDERPTLLQFVADVIKEIRERVELENREVPQVHVMLL